jgi:PAS domain S-box-containing protein
VHPSLAGDRLALHELLLEHTEDAIVTVDRDWAITAWSKGAERMYGWSAGEVLGRLVPSFVRMDLSEEERAEVRREVAERGRWRGEATVERKDGSTVSVEVINVAVRDASGEITGFLGIHRDVGDRRLAREAQRRSETILESITDAFAAVDAEWRLTYVNERARHAMEALRGRALPRADLLGRSLWEELPLSTQTVAYERMHQAVRDRESVVFEYRYPDGPWFEVHAYPSADGMAMYFRDVTERHRVEEERETRARQQAVVAQLGLRALRSAGLQSLMDEAVDLVARTLDVEFAGVGELTPGREEIILRAGFGLRAGVVGGRIGDLATSSSLSGYTLRVREPVLVDDIGSDPRFTPAAIASEHGVVSALSVMIESPDEPFGVLAAHSTRRRAFSASEVSFVQAVANVLAGAVERSRAQERLGAVREAERSRIARDLHDDALQELTDALVRAERGRSAGLGPDAAQQLVSTLKRVGRQLRGAIYDLRLSDDVRRPFPEALAALVDVHRAMAVECELDLDVAWEPPTDPVGHRGVEVLRIVGEALTNARRHAAARHVRVSARRSEDQVRVEIADDGRGFDAASSGGDGMGIKGMRERAALAGGDLEVRSAPGAGTTIRFELGPPPHDEPPTTRARILLVEDHAPVREAIAGMFGPEADLDVVGQAGSVAEARGMLRDVDVAVVDLGLPDGYGGDLIRELRAVSPHAQALVLSASLDPAEIARALESGAAVTLDKTADLDQLVDTVRRLHRAGLGDAAPASAIT